MEITFLEVGECFNKSILLILSHNFFCFAVLNDPMI